MIDKIFTFSHATMTNLVLFFLIMCSISVCIVYGLIKTQNTLSKILEEENETLKKSIDETKTLLKILIETNYLCLKDLENIPDALRRKVEKFLENE